MPDSLHRHTANRLLELLRNKEIKPLDVVDAVFKQIDNVEDKIKAYLLLMKEQAEQRARELESADTSLPLYGIPVAVKDNMCMRGIPTTCASKILAGFKPPYDATVVEDLKRAGAIIIGKTNMDEFAMGSSCENSGYHPTRNPWDTDRVPGGSSGGSAAAVAADETILALGSDTGGSIRQPASFCGVVGLKPTYGAVSRYGLVAFASSLDQIGPLAKDVTDAALLMNVIGHHDPKDSTSINQPPQDYTADLEKGVEGLKICMVHEFLPDDMDPKVFRVVNEANIKFEKIGAIPEDESKPVFDYALPAYYIIAPAEASSNLARYDGVQYGHRSPEADDILAMFFKTRREGFGAEVKRRIMLGTYALSAGYYDAYYLRALKVRSLITRAFMELFEKYDLLIGATSPTVAFKIGEKVGDPIAMYMSDLCTIPVNLAGLPSISIPCGFADGLPVGLQIIGKPFDEATILRAARAYERAAPFERKEIPV
ncbi:MAG: Asp-tRNA(Asn)/Glu-tRNA(Gln) amidotransferase subunit GatA [bacterium]